MTQTSLILKQLETGKAYDNAVKMGQDGTIDEIKASQLRGRGGAGFPTGLKLEITKKANGEKILVCNADEGEMGTFKDIKLLSEYRENFIEGMAIAAFALGAKKGFIYLRWEYSFLRDDLQTTIDNLSSKWSDLNLEIRMGAGAYVCGEETALLDSLEGHRGESRNKPPYPVEEGYLGLPTAINNVETFSCISLILAEGASTFNAIGTKKSKGPKLFSISGDVEKPGVYEFALGTSIKEVLQTAGAKDVKAVIVGGASGTCISNTQLDRVLAFEDLPPGGAIIVLNNFRSIAHTLENILDFFLEETCGQCVPCREGVNRLQKFVVSLQNNPKVTEKEFKRYMDLANTIKIASKCGLGQSSVNVYLSALQSFSNELITIEG